MRPEVVECRAQVRNPPASARHPPRGRKAMSPAAAEDVIRFLEENPGFFIEHPEFLRASGILGEASAKVLNLRERLFDRLKGEREDLLGLLDETIELVRRNEQIEQDFIALDNLLFEIPLSAPPPPPLPPPLPPPA